MPKASFELPDGTLVTIEGTSTEIQELLDYYGGRSESKHKPAKQLRSKKPVSKGTEKDGTKSSEVDLALVVNTTKICSEAESIENQILSKNTEVDRVLIPLYIVHEYLDNAFPLTTTQIAKITTELGNGVTRQNSLRALKGAGSGYVISDTVRKHGAGTPYRLNKRGVKYIKSVLSREAEEK